MRSPISGFFCQSNPSWPLSLVLRYFWKIFFFSTKLWTLFETPQCLTYCGVKLRCVQDSAKSKAKESGKTLQYSRLCWVRLCYIWNTVESNSAVFDTPRSMSQNKYSETPWYLYSSIKYSQNSAVFQTRTRTLRCLTHRGVKLHGVQHTAESGFSLSIRGPDRFDEWKNVKNHVTLSL